MTTCASINDSCWTSRRRARQSRLCLYGYELSSGSSFDHHRWLTKTTTSAGFRTLVLPSLLRGIEEACKNVASSTTFIGATSLSYTEAAAAWRSMNEELRRFAKRCKKGGTTLVISRAPLFTAGLEVSRRTRKVAPRACEGLVSSFAAAGESPSVPGGDEDSGLVT